MSIEKEELPSLDKLKGKENRLIGLGLMLATVNDCSCKVCKLLRKAQREIIETQVGELDLD